jgi:hypothetical protein
MAIPTDFKGPTPAANTTKSFKLFGSTTVGLWALDIDGTLSATTNVVPIGTNLAMVMDQAYTDAQLIPLVKDWLARMGALPATAPAGDRRNDEASGRDRHDLHVTGEPNGERGNRIFADDDRDGDRCRQSADGDDVDMATANAERECRRASTSACTSSSGVRGG